MYLLPVYLLFNCVFYCLLHRTQIWGRGSDIITKCVPDQPTRTTRQFCRMSLGGAAMLWKWGGQRHVWPAALECGVKQCCSRRLQVRVTQNCRTEVLEHRQDQVLSEPKWDKKASNHKVRKCKRRRPGWQYIDARFLHSFWKSRAGTTLEQDTQGCLPQPRLFSCLCFILVFRIPHTSASSSGWCGLRLAFWVMWTSCMRALCEHRFNSYWWCLTITSGQVAALLWLPSQQREPW